MNLRLAFRSLWKTPTVTAVAVISLALGIGANAAIFSLFEQMILSSVPARSPNELVNLVATGPKSGARSTGHAGEQEAIFSYPMFRDLERMQTSFTGLAAHSAFSANLAYGGVTLSAQGLLVSGSYFGVLGLEPAAGRLFGPDDDRTPGAHPLVVLAHGFWRRQFDANPAVVGRNLMVNGLPMTILGVAPQGFEGTTLGQNPRIFVPISMRERMIPVWQGLDNRKSYWAYLFARLAPGISRAEAESALDGRFRNILREVELPLQSGRSEEWQRRFANQHLKLEAGHRGQSSLQKEVRKPLLMLFGVSALVLLIAAANVANLLLVRATRRSGEIAVRLAIGARRHQLVAQLLGESLILATFGSAGGLLIARVTLQSLAPLLPADSGLEIGLEMSPAWWAFVAVLTLVTTLVGLFPALHGTRRDLVTAVSSQAGRIFEPGGARRFRAAMVVFQIALSTALLITAGLFARSLYNVSRVDLGIDVEHLATFGLSPELNGYEPEASRALFGRVEEEIRTLPGVRGVAASMVPLIAGHDWTRNVTVQGFAAGPDADTSAHFNEIGPGYFATLGIPRLAGREIEPGDDLEAPRVAVVNHSFARKFGLGDDAVGKWMHLGSGGELDVEIVGLVGDAKYSQVKQDTPPTFFLPYRQDEGLGTINFYVRAAGDPSQLLASLRSAVARLDPNLPIDSLTTMSMQVRNNVFLDRSLSALSAAFAILATVLAGAGLYGVMAYSVVQRTREIGLRMVLGADAGRVRGLILGQVGRLTVIGAGLGVAAALALADTARSLLFGLAGNEPSIFLLAVAILALIAAGAGLLPAQRAARVEPLEALRHP